MASSFPNSAVIFEEFGQAGISWLKLRFLRPDNDIFTPVRLQAFVAAININRDEKM